MRHFLLLAVLFIFLSGFTAPESNRVEYFGIPMCYFMYEDSEIAVYPRHLEYEIAGAYIIIYIEEPTEVLVTYSYYDCNANGCDAVRCGGDYYLNQSKYVE